MAPVYPIPPHWPYSATVPLVGGGLAALDVDVGPEEVVGPGDVVEPPPVEPEEPYKGGPGIV